MKWCVVCWCGWISLAAVITLMDISQRDSIFYYFIYFFISPSSRTKIYIFIRIKERKKREELCRVVPWKRFLLRGASSSSSSVEINLPMRNLRWATQFMGSERSRRRIESPTLFSKSLAGLTSDVCCGWAYITRVLPRLFIARLTRLTRVSSGSFLLAHFFLDPPHSLSINVQHLADLCLVCFVDVHVDHGMASTWFPSARQIFMKVETDVSECYEPIEMDQFGWLK